MDIVYYAETYKMDRPVLNNLSDLNKLHTDPGAGFEFFTLAKEFPLNATKEYSSITAWWCAEFSRLAYVTNTDRIKNECTKIGFKIEFFYACDTEAHIAWNDEYIICFFRGTQPDQIGDIISDLRFRKKQSHTQGFVHSGFKDSLDVVWDDMEILLNIIDNGKRTFLFTGHSLGAALATLAAARWLKETIVYTFGSPRCGDKQFVIGFDLENTHHRFTNDSDIVPHLPPRFMDFVHTGRRHVIDYRKGFDYQDDGKGGVIYQHTMKVILSVTKLWVRTAIAATAIVVRRFVTDKITDHSMAHYSKYLETHLREMLAAK